MSDDIFREVEEEVRRDQLLAFWRKYRYAIIAAIVVIVLAVAGYQGWQTYQHRQRQAAAEHYAAAEAQLVSGDRESALRAFAEMADPDAGGYALLAAFEVAQIAAEDGDGARALDTWGRIAGSSAARAYRDAAVLAAAGYRIEQGELEESEAMLAPLAEAGGPYRALALELMAVAAMARGETASARTELEGLLADIEVPAGTRERARDLIGTLGE